MKVLLDYSAPVQLREAFANDEVQTANQLGWGEIEDGELIRLAESNGFDLLLVCEKNLAVPEGKRRLRIIEIWSNHRPSLQHRYPFVRLVAETMKPGEYRVMAAP